VLKITFGARTIAQLREQSLFELVASPMLHLRASFFLPLLFILGGCGRPPVECESPETRNAVLAAVSDDHGNALAVFAAKNSNVPASDANSERAKPFYRLGDTMVTISTSGDKRTLKCTGMMSVVVGDTRASKNVNFTAQRSTDGKLSVSVEPFQFDPN
jgi:hypothetical protein